MLDIVDGLRNLLEPTPAVSGVTVHDTGAAPMFTEMDIGMGSKHLWVYTVDDDHELAGVGNPPEEREVFTVDAMFVLDDTREREQGIRIRDLSVQLDTQAHAYTELCAANRSKYSNGSAAPWDNLITSISPLDEYRGLDVRGFVLHMTGYRNLRY